MTEQEIEQSFQKAIGIEFWPSENIDKKPPVIGLIFNDAREGSVAYDYLRTTFAFDDLTAVFKPTENRVDLSLINTKNALVFNIYSLKFDNTSYIDFKNSGHGTGVVVLLMFEIHNGQLIVRQTESNSPLTFKGSVFSE